MFENGIITKLTKFFSVV